MAKRHSSEFRLCRALLCNSFKRNKLNSLIKQTDQGYISYFNYQVGRSDFQKFRLGNRLVSTKRTLQRFRLEAVDQAVSFIYSPSNVSFLSWGSKLVIIDGVTKPFPLVNRKRSMIHIYEDYVKLKNDNNSVVNRELIKPLTKTSFLRVCRSITHQGTELRRAVDYVTGFLVNDNFDLIRRMIDDLIPSTEDRNKLHEEMEIARRYLKYGFDESLMKSTESTSCPIHNISFGLVVSLPSSGLQSNSPSCTGCKNLFSFFDKLAASFSELEISEQSAFSALENCLLKSRLFLGHRLRVTNQQIAMKQIIHEMKMNCKQLGFSETALIVVDFKMKLDPTYWREKTVDHYGKRGMSWHGALIQFYTMNPPDDDNNQSEEPVLSKFYLDQICGNDSKQDKFAVVSLLESILIAIKRQHPHIKKIILQSDNAGCYQNVSHFYMIPYLSYVHGIEIVRFIHSETQDGKSVLDAHFARSMQAIYAWCKEGNNCLTPTQAVEALKSYGGLFNSTVELINHDRTRLMELERHFNVLEKELRKRISRTNDVFFSYGKSVTSNPVYQLGGPDSYRVIPDFKITAFEYSG